ncbi:ester cyclase [Candidatus Thiodiazotropha sp. CDECU1]|uniref:ester cyclase n=1 Tax=Candidatus Thiodiazotropha sp. CDECU1 TaxID=3065865 RepID=UPI00292E0617|nr:ester cyclase [Candidatus Thiodiazotropha sp. CDECU1]
MSLKNEMTMRRFVEQVINKGNFPVLDEVIHPNYVYRSPDQVLQGQEALRELLTTYRSAFPDLHIEIEEMVSAGNKTVISITLSGTHKGDLMGIGATGRQVKASGMILSHFENGKIVEEWELLDQLTLYQQLGIVSIHPETATGNNEESAMHTETSNEQTTEGTTLVVGGTGKTGRRVAERLQARGVETCIASRTSNPSFDWNDPSTWNAVLERVTTAYITYAPDLAIPGATDSIRRFVDQAVAQGVKRLVLLSGRGEEEAQACERIIQQAGVEWTVVRASWFMQNFSEGEFLGMVLDGTITLPAADVPEPFIDINDIADVVVAALTEEGHAGEIYEVTGPRTLTFTELAHEISQAAGREVQFVQIPKQAFTQAIAESGAPDDIAWLLNYLFETVLDGRNAHVCDGVKRALGREPTDFTDYARRITARGTWNAKHEEGVAA